MVIPRENILNRKQLTLNVVFDLAHITGLYRATFTFAEAYGLSDIVQLDAIHLRIMF